MEKDRRIRPANFDWVARPYRWLEYITFGPLLQQARTHLLPYLKDCRHALLFGDGDGRFTARLLAQNPQLTADAVDTSAAMLNLLNQRAQPVLAFPRQSTTVANIPRIRTHKQSALTFIPIHPPDLVVTHFFLDCLTQIELDALIQQLAPRLSQDALWLISDFRVPPGLLRLPACLLIRSLYFAFRILTGLRITHLPIHDLPLRQAGFVCVAQHRRLFGLITTELWHAATRCECGETGLRLSSET